MKMSYILCTPTFFSLWTHLVSSIQVHDQAPSWWPHEEEQLDYEEVVQLSFWLLQHCGIPRDVQGVDTLVQKLVGMGEYGDAFQDMMTPSFLTSVSLPVSPRICVVEAAIQGKLSMAAQQVVQDTCASSKTFATSVVLLKLVELAPKDQFQDMFGLLLMSIVRCRMQEDLDWAQIMATLTSVCPPTNLKMWDSFSEVLWGSPGVVHCEALLRTIMPSLNQARKKKLFQNMVLAFANEDLGQLDVLQPYMREVWVQVCELAYSRRYSDNDSTFLLLGFLVQAMESDDQVYQQIAARPPIYPEQELRFTDWMHRFFLRNIEEGAKLEEDVDESIALLRRLSAYEQAMDRLYGRKPCETVEEEISVASSILLEENTNHNVTIKVLGDRQHQHLYFLGVNNRKQTISITLFLEPLEEEGGQRFELDFVLSVDSDEISPGEWVTLKALPLVYPPLNTGLMELWGAWSYSWEFSQEDGQSEVSKEEEEARFDEEEELSGEQEGGGVFQQDVDPFQQDADPFQQTSEGERVFAQDEEDRASLLTSDDEFNPETAFLTTGEDPFAEDPFAEDMGGSVSDEEEGGEDGSEEQELEEEPSVEENSLMTSDDEYNPETAFLTTEEDPFAQAEAYSEEEEASLLTSDDEFNPETAFLTTGEDPFAEDFETMDLRSYEGENDEEEMESEVDEEEGQEGEQKGGQEGEQKGGQDLEKSQTENDVTLLDSDDEMDPETMWMTTGEDPFAEQVEGDQEEEEEEEFNASFDETQLKKALLLSQGYSNEEVELLLM